MVEEREDGGDEGPGGEEERRGGTSPWEWAVAAVGALLVLGVVATMLQEALGPTQTPPTVEVVVDTIVETQYGYVVEFLAHNHGRRTAAGLTVEGELRSDTGTVEKAQATVDYVPAESRRRGGLLFTNDPRRYALELRPKGYDVP